MKNYLIESLNDVFKDDFNEGEGDHVNCYTMEAKISAKNHKEAIKLFCENKLGYPVKIEDIKPDEEYKDSFWYSWTVGKDNILATKAEIEEWRKGKHTLYSNNARISVYALIELNI